MACLDENALVAYLQRRLPESAHQAAEQHVSSCPACRGLIEEMALVFASDSDAVEPMPALGPGSRIGRYVVLRRVGAGAFGVVYAAFDPELDRKVALKVLRSDRASDAAWRERFLREARAMARLSHPNVTQVYDVHAEGERLSIAMEFVEGTNLAEWGSEPKPWREVLRIFLAAGRGLEAAHAAGLIHRDFKPANVLIGDDGRVSVTDFGLAQMDHEAHASVEVTGTPRYMAPEQHAGRVGSAADQFGFAVALYEALYGVHPFAWATSDELARAVRNGARRPPPQAIAVPRWLTGALDRALASEPARRFPSMKALLEQIAVEPRNRRNRRFAYLGLFALLAAIPAARVYDVHRREALLCKGGATKVAEIWNPAVQDSLQSAFLATERPWAQESAAAVNRALDRWLARWASDFTETCEATRIRGEQSDRVLTERMLCLDRARAEAKALIAELTRADGSAVDRAVESARTLAPLDACADVEALLTPLEPPRRIRAAVEGVRESLAEARAVAATGRLPAAMEKNVRALKSAETLGHTPLLAEAELAVGRGQAQVGRFEEAQASLRSAIEHAAQGHHDRVSAEAWIDLVLLVGAVGDREEAALAQEEAARAAIARLSGHPELSAKLDSAVGLILAALGRYPEAVERHRGALSEWERAFGPQSLEAGLEHDRLAEVLLASGELGSAEDHAARAQAILDDTYGRLHPILALPLTVLAEVACDRGDFIECGRRIERAIALRASAGAPPGHPTFLPKRLILVRALAGAGRRREAEHELEAAAAIAAGDSWKGRVAMARATLEGDPGAASRAVALLRASLPKDHPDVAEALLVQGNLLRARGKRGAARLAWEEAARIFEASLGRKSPRLLEVEALLHADG